MKTYEFDGERYREASRHQRAWGRGLIGEITFAGNERILDLGCGDGTLTCQLAQKVPAGSVLGVDASEGMLRAASALDLPNLEFRKMDINAMAFDGEFDIIFSNAALHWIHDHDRLLKNAWRALREGGRLAWNFAGKGTGSSFIPAVSRIMEDGKYSRYFADFVWPWHMPSAEEYREHAEEAGFAAPEVREELQDRYFRDRDEMIRWINQPSLVPFLSTLPQEMQKAFRDEVVGEMLEKTLQPDGTCFETFRRLHVSAVKP